MKKEQREKIFDQLCVAYQEGFSEYDILRESLIAKLVTIHQYDKEYSTLLVDRVYEAWLRINPELDPGLIDSVDRVVLYAEKENKEFIDNATKMQLMSIIIDGDVERDLEENERNYPTITFDELKSDLSLSGIYFIEYEEMDKFYHAWDDSHESVPEVALINKEKLAVFDNRDGNCWGEGFDSISECFEYVDGVSADDIYEKRGGYEL